MACYFDLARSILATPEDKEMAGKGKKFLFHGSFSDKQKAVEKEKEVGGFIREHTVSGKTRYYVLTAKEKA